MIYISKSIQSVFKVGIYYRVKRKSTKILQEIMAFRQLKEIPVKPELKGFKG